MTDIQLIMQLSLEQNASNTGDELDSSYNYFSEYFNETNGNGIESNTDNQLESANKII